MNVFTYCAACFLMLGCAKGKNESPNPGDTTKINTIYDLNKEQQALDSHAGEESSSVLELDYNTNIVVPSATLGVSTPVYSRIKKAKNASYKLFYQNNQVAANVYFSTSADLHTWAPGKLLFEEKPIVSTLGDDLRRFSSADATVLSNGDIIAVASFRANKAYRYSPETNGIMMRRSKDNGLTWGSEQVIYVGTNWEPYLLELPSGQLQCYFTDTEPNTRNSGTSIVVSDNNGVSWSPSGVGNSYKVIRQYKYMNGNNRIYTDQMPSVKMLNDGKTLAAFVEARIEDNGPTDENSYYMMSLVYGTDNWPHLSGDQVSTNRQSNLFRGAGGYLAQFRSGETVISCNISNLFSMKIGDNKARNFNHRSWDTDWFQPFSGTGYWGSLEIAGTHEILGTMHKSGGIMIGRFILNHRINAPSKAINVDGETEEWLHTDALFIGSESQTQTSFRAASDSKNLYLLVERRDNYVATGDNVDLYIHDNNGKVLNENSIKLTIDPNGLVASYKWAGSWKAFDGSGIIVKSKVSGGANDGNPDEGYLSEVSIPFSTIGSTNNYVRFNAVVTDGKVNDTFTFANADKPETWMLIKNGNAN